jgi:hypothetical protein
MKTKTLLLCLMLVIILPQLSAQKSSKQNDYTVLSDPSPFQERLNGKVKNLVVRLYWTTGPSDNIKKGKSISTRERDSLNWPYDFEASFDELGDHIINYNTLDDNNKSFTRYQFIRENGQLVLSKWTLGKIVDFGYGPYSKGDGYTKSTYDNKGYLVGRADYSSDGDVLLYSFKLKNNDSGDQIEGQTFDNKGNFIMKWTSSYNDKRQDISGDWTDKDGKIAGYYKNNYNDKGKLSENTFFDKDKKMTFSNMNTYLEYDAKGNWLKSAYKNNLGQSAFCERTITYFE